MGLIFDIASAQEVPFSIPQYIQCILHRLTSVLLCAPFIFADSEVCSEVLIWWLHMMAFFVFIMETVYSGYLDYRSSFDLYCCVMS